MNAVDSEQSEAEQYVDWRTRAACRGEDPELFFPAANLGPAYEAQVMAAKSVCRRCPVRASCLAEALRRMPYGIAGGLTEQERRRVRPASVVPAPKWRALLEAGRPHPEIARKCGVTVRTVERWASQLRRAQQSELEGGAR